VLAAVRPVLIDLQAGLCFYCGDRLGDTRIEVDHFIPWSRYAADLGHNLVLADIKCNNRKARPHSRRRAPRPLDRNARYGGEIPRALRDQLPVDLGCSIRVAHWAYSQTEAAGGLTWLRREVMEPLRPEWRIVSMPGESRSSLRWVTVTLISVALRRPLSWPCRTPR
jgi:hypothetical protein